MAVNHFETSGSDKAVRWLVPASKRQNTIERQTPTLDMHQHFG